MFSHRSREVAVPSVFDVKPWIGEFGLSQFSFRRTGADKRGSASLDRQDRRLKRKLSLQIGSPQTFPPPRVCSSSFKQWPKMFPFRLRRTDSLCGSKFLESGRQTAANHVAQLAIGLLPAAELRVRWATSVGFRRDENSGAAVTPARSRCDLSRGGLLEGPALSQRFTTTG